MNCPKKIVIVAGEESGDMHGANLVKELSTRSSQIYNISGIGGHHLEAVGVRIIYNLAQYGVTGLTETLAHLWTIKKAYTTLKEHLKEVQPNLLILIDYPGFNLRVAQYAKTKLKLKILYYISPQLWAWKPKRIEIVRNYVDWMAVILPFEKKIYEQANISSYFVGHPLINKLNTIKNNLLPIKLPKGYKVVALLPGSRKNEIKRHLPVMLQAAAKLSQITKTIFLIPIAQSLDSNYVKSFAKNSNFPLLFLENQTYETLAQADLVIVASGTASFETALLEKPMCIIYKTSWITFMVASKLLKIKYLGLCNLLANKMIVPELLQYDCDKNELFKLMQNILFNSNYRQKMQQNLTLMKERFSTQQIDCSIAELVQNVLAS